MYLIQIGKFYIEEDLQLAKLFLEAALSVECLEGGLKLFRDITSSHSSCINHQRISEIILKSNFPESPFVE